jgi:hypothetical protein
MSELVLLEGSTSQHPFGRLFTSFLGDQLDKVGYWPSVDAPSSDDRLSFVYETGISRSIASLFSASATGVEVFMRSTVLCQIL